MVLKIGSSQRLLESEQSGFLNSEFLIFENCAVRLPLNMRSSNISFPEFIKLLSRGFRGKTAETALTVNSEAKRFSRSKGIKFSENPTVNNISQKKGTWSLDIRNTFLSCITESIFSDLLAESTQASINAHTEELTSG